MCQGSHHSVNLLLQTSLSSTRFKLCLKKKKKIQNWWESFNDWGESSRKNFTCLASLFPQWMTTTSVWYPLETVNMCWLEPVSCHLQSLLFCCLRATQSGKTFLDIKAMSVHCGRRGACWLRTVIILLMTVKKRERSQVAVLCQVSTGFLWGWPIYAFCVCTPW